MQGSAVAPIFGALHQGVGKWKRGCCLPEPGPCCAWMGRSSRLSQCRLVLVRRELPCGKSEPRHPRTGVSSAPFFAQRTCPSTEHGNTWRTSSWQPTRATSAAASAWSATAGSGCFARWPWRIPIAAAGSAVAWCRNSSTGRASGLETLVLLTLSAPEYFPRFGFRVIARAAAPAEVQVSEEFRTACPASATVMQLDLHGEAPA